MATLEAVGIGLLIPLLSAIIPIQRSLAKSLSESLNTARSSLSGTIVIIEGKGVKMIPYVIFGLLCVTFGVTIYIVLPQALLAENAGLILQIFFAILGCLILGLTLLTANLRGFIEIIMVYLLFFWERKSMRALLKKNLISHKQTNKLTSIIYALTLGCVIFLSVSLNLLIKSGAAISGTSECDISVTTGMNTYPMMNTTEVDAILQAYQDKIEDFAFVTGDIYYFNKDALNRTKLRSE